MTKPDQPADDSEPIRVPADLPLQSPDLAEEQLGPEMDNIIPTRCYDELPVVGLGGSAGSIAALTTFFGATPERTGFAYVVVIHLSPEHASTLPEVLGRATRMAVQQAADGMAIRADCIYVIPPGKHLSTFGGRLRLSDLVHAPGQRLAVDLFLRSLADTHGPHAMAVILSGVGDDGAIGIKRIKERGGLTVAQDPNEAEHNGMPQAAIETGMVDWVLRAAEIPARLLAYHRREDTIEMPPEETIPTAASEAVQVPEDGLQQVLAFVRTRTGRDFSYYKRATILRRISRRMQVMGVDDLPGYLALLRTNAGEARALMQDLLISVTNFFRDRDAVAALEQHLPRLFRDRGPGDTIRAWVPACATGEEAYSIAMLLLEQARALNVTPVIQVFGSDLNSEAIHTARAGVYPAAIAADVSEERLQRFFTPTDGHYRVRRELRERVLFTVHDLLKDAPFSRMDLISCRNLLIYLAPEAQKRALALFHFGLKPGGLLFLGTSESAEDGSELFAVLDKKRRLYTPHPSTRTGVPVPKDAGTLARLLEEKPRPEQSSLLAAGALGAAPGGPNGMPAPRSSPSEVHYQLIERFGPPSLVVNADYDIQHLSRQAGRFIQFSGGEPTTNLLRLVPPALRLELRALLFRVTESGEPATASQLAVELEGRPCLVDATVYPAGEIAPGCLLVTLDARPQDAAPLPTGAEPVARHLERELEQMQQRLREAARQYEASHEELKASNEELKASNEELQAMNEELRSAAEELETSREELQSINEQLSVVNAELKSKVDELALSNGDLQNLMASTAIATVFLDRDLKITRFTPSAVAIFHLIDSDIGRPLTDLRHQLDYAKLRADAELVLATLVPVEREVREPGGGTYLARLLPYRTVDDRIAGVVLTLVDVSEQVRAQQELRFSEERLRLVIESAKDYAIFTLDTAGMVNSWNGGAEAMFGYPEQEIIGQSGHILFTPEDRAKGEADREIRTALNEGRAANERWHIRRDQSLFYGSGSLMALRDSSGALHGFVKIMRDLTESKRTEEAMREHVEELTRFNQATEGRELRMIELKREINALSKRLGELPPHPLEFEQGQSEPRST